MKKQIIPILLLFTLLLTGCFNKERDLSISNYNKARDHYISAHGISYSKTVTTKFLSDGIVTHTEVETYENEVEFSANGNVRRLSSYMERKDQGILTYRINRFFASDGVYIHTTNISLGLQNKDYFNKTYEEHYDPSSMHSPVNIIPHFVEDDISEFVIEENGKGSKMTFKAPAPSYVNSEELITYKVTLNNKDQFSTINYTYLDQGNNEITVNIVIKGFNSFVKVVLPSDLDTYK